MELMLAEIAQRVRATREMLEISLEEMAQGCSVTLEQYQALEQGQTDFTFGFLYQCAEIFGIDMIALLTGSTPKLTFYSIVRAGRGLPIRRREGFTYHHLAPRFKDKVCDPLLVTAPYREEEQNQPVALSNHEGQEFDYVLKGSLKIRLEDHVEILKEGDSIFFDSSHGHGMIATGGEDCIFLAMVLKD